MTTSRKPGPAAGGADAPLVAGLGASLGSERDADAFAHALQSELEAGGAHGLVIASHAVSVGGSRRIALTVEADGVESDRLWDFLTAALGTEDAPALLLDDRYDGCTELRSALADAVGRHRSRRSGRVVVFPGSDELTGALQVAALLARSAIDRVRVLAAGDADPATIVHTRDFVRPRWKAAELVLDVQPAAHQTLVPFETPFPTPCCAAH